MKKRAILILSAMMATGMLFTGCSSSGNNQKTEKSEEETKYADEQFIKDMSKGNICNVRKVSILSARDYSTAGTTTGR